MPSFRTRSSLLARVFGTATLFLFCRASHATTLSVSSLADDGSAGTLRSQIAAASADDTLVFDVTGTITLNGTELLLNKNLTIQGPANAPGISISANKKSRVFEVASGTKVSLSNLSITNGLASPNAVGAGISNVGTLTLSAVTLSNNSGTRGGGIWNTGTLDIANSAFSSNQSYGVGGAIWNSGTVTLDGTTFTSNVGSYGGGVYNSGAMASIKIKRSSFSTNAAEYHSNGDYPSGGAICNEGLLTVEGTTLSGNKATAGGALFNTPTGNATVTRSTFTTNSGGYSGGGFCNRGVLAVENSTFYANTVANDGAALYNSQNATLSLNSNTFARNWTQSGGVGNVCNDGTVTLGNNLFGDDARNIGGSIGFNGGVVTSTGYNLSASFGWDVLYLTNPRDRFSFSFGDALKLDPAGLKDNGGPTQTIALLPGSPAIDVGNATGADQRGVPRPFDFASLSNAVAGNGSDIGAFEVQAGLPASFGLTATPNPLPTGTSLSLTLRILDANGYAAENYRGTVHFTSTDMAASLPTDYTFMASDAGTHTFTATLNTLGTQTLSVTDPSSSFSKSVNVTVTETPSLQVNTTSDILSNTDGQTSLRDAIAYAGTLTGTPTITFDPSLFGAPQTISLTTYIAITHNVIIQGPGARLLTIDAQRKSDPISVRQNVSATLSGLTITGAYSCAVSNSGNVTISSCTITNNGGTYSEFPAVYNDFSYPTKATLIDSTISGNTSKIGTVGDLGSAIFNGGQLVATNCTISGNKGASAVAIYRSCTTTLNNCTLSGNTASASATATIAFTTAYSTYTTSTGEGLTLDNCIVAGNTGTDIRSSSTVKGDYNVLGTVPGITFAGSSNKLGIINPGLGALKNNGGATDTLALLAGSPALNAGDPAFDSTGLTNDQRGAGFARMRDARVDSGAFEAQNTTPVLSEVSITPLDVKTNDTLNSAFLASDTDGDTLTTSSLWKKNGQILPNEKGATLDLSQAGNGDANDVISVLMTIDDGHGGTVSRESNTVTVANSAPTIKNLLLAPNTPAINDTLSLSSATVTDADGDGLTTTYQWKKNGVSIAGQTGSTLDLSLEGNGNKGDQISVVVTADDAHGGTDAKESQAVTIGNSTPALGSIELSPNNPKTNERVSATLGSATDADGDTLTTTYQWKKNGVPLPGETGATLDLSVAGNGDRGDQVMVVVALSDGTSSDSVESAPVTVDNSAPSVTSATIDNQSPTTNSLLTASGSATDADGDTLTYTYVWKKNGIAIAGETGATLDLSVAGNGDKGDVISVIVTADDGQGGTASKESQGVAIVGSAPTGLSLSPSSIAENQLPGTTVGAFTTSGMDAGNSYSYSLVAGAGDTDNAAFKIAGATLLSNHPFDFESKASYSIRVRSVDGDGKAVETIFTITITDVNEAPSVRVTLSPAAPTTNTLLQATTTGSDPDGDAITFTYQWKKGGAVLVGETGSTLDLSKAGNGDKGDTLSVVVVPVDGTLSGTGATASTTVLNSAPTLSPATFQGRENQVLPGQLAGQDADREALSYSLVSPPRSGTLALQSSGAFAYTPRSNWNGTDTFQARVRDGSGATATALFTLRIAPANGTPVALNDVVKGFEDTPLSIPASLLLRNDSNGENVGEVDALQIVRVAVPTGFPGTLKLDVARQTITFTPKLNWNGTTTFTYTVQDSGKATVTAQVTLQIAPVNDAPVAFPGRMIVLSGVLGEVPLSGTDVEGDALAFALGTKPTSGAAVVVKVGTQWKLRYQSKVGFSGTDTLSVIARDGKLNSAPATITITVKPNHAPQLVSVLPNKGTFAAGTTVVFEQKVRDADGTANLDATALLIGNLPTVANARGGATLWFDAVGNRFTLTRDDGTTTPAPVALGGTLENSQVKVTLGAGDVARDSYGNLTLKWRVTFKPGFVGTKSVWARAEDLGGLSAGFTNSGQITLTAPTKDAPISPSAPTS